MSAGYAAEVCPQRSRHVLRNTSWRKTVILLRVSLRNVRRYAGQQTIDFPLPEGNKRVHLVSANNGVGKTTLFESINACLFATKEDPILRAKDITRISGQPEYNEMLIEMEFEHESQSYVLNRRWSRRPGPSEYSVNSVSLSSLLQNQDIGDSSTDEDEIAAFMRSLIPFETRQLFLFDGEQVQTYIDQASESVRDAIERLLGLHLYIRLGEDVRRIEQELQTERRSHDVSEDLLGKQEALDQNEVQLRSNERRQQELRRASADAKSQYARLQMEESRLEGMFDPVRQSKRRELEFQRVALISDVERHENAMTKLVQDELVASLFWPEIGEAVGCTSRVESILPGSLSELAELLYRNRHVISEALESDSLESIEATLRQSLGGLPESEVPFNLRDGLIHLADLIESGKEKLTVHPEQLQAKFAELDRVGHEIASLPSAELFDMDVRRLHEEMEGLRTTQARHEESLKSLARDRERLSVESEGLKRDIVRLSEDNRRYRSIGDKIEVCRGIREVLEVFVNDYRSTRVGELSHIVNDKFREFTNAPGLIDAIEIDRESVELKLVARTTEMDAGEQSAGQKEILAFALIASVVELSNRQVPAVIDTPLARLDARHRDNVLRHFFPNLGPQVIVLATDTELGRQEVDQLSPILASRHHLHLDMGSGCTTIRDGYLDE